PRKVTAILFTLCSGLARLATTLPCFACLPTSGANPVPDKAGRRGRKATVWYGNCICWVLILGAREGDAGAVLTRLGRGGANSSRSGASDNPSVICDITGQGAYCGAGICCESTSTGVTQRHKVYKRIANFTLNLKELHDGRYRQPVGAPNDGARLDRRACDFRNCSLVHTVRHGYEQ